MRPPLPLLILALGCAPPAEPDDSGPGSPSTTTPPEGLPDGPVLLFTDRDAGQLYAWTEAEGLLLLAGSLPDPRGLVVRDDAVYWVDSSVGLLFTWTPAVPEPTPVIAGLTQPADLVWRGEGWLVADRGANRILWVDETSARYDQVPATPEPYFLVHDGAELWWGDFAGGAVRRAPLEGGLPPAVAVTDQGAVRGVALHQGQVFWTDRELGTLSAAPTSGPTTPTVLYTDLGTPHGLTVFDDRLWWTDTATGRIQSAPVDGSSAPEVVVDGLVGPWDLVWRR